jgi:hypothetical protein
MVMRFPAMSLSIEIRYALGTFPETIRVRVAKISHNLVIPVT